MSFDLNQHMARLLINEPFFASLSRKIQKTETRAIPTAGVRVTEEGRFEMLYNPEFFESLPDKQRLGVLKHEFYHLIFEHVTSRKVEGVNPKTQNIAADLAINSHSVGELPDNCCMPGVGPFAEYPKGLTFEAYLKMIQKDQEENQQEDDDNQEEGGGGSAGGDGEPGDDQEDGDSSGGGGQQFDDHSGWSDEVSPEAQAMAKERLKQDLKEAAQEASGKGDGWGTCSQSVREEVLERLKTVIDWKKVLRYFIKTSQKASKSSTVRRINKRYPWVHAGKKVKRQAKIAIAIDQSGSVSNELLATFFSELNSLAKLASFTVIPFDTRVDESLVYEWKKGQHHKVERVMYGGTCFDAPTEYINKCGNFDGAIILTDMEAPKPKACKAQRMWMTDANGQAYPYFKTSERVIPITTI